MKNIEKQLPCDRFYMDQDEYREALACRLERLYVKWGGDLSVAPNPTDAEVAELYNCIREREAELAAEERSPNVLGGGYGKYNIADRKTDEITSLPCKGAGP